MATEIAGAGADNITLEVARSAARAEFGLAQIRRVKVALIAQMSAFGEFEVPDPFRTSRDITRMVTLIDRAFTVGNLVSPSSGALATIASEDPIYVIFQASEEGNPNYVNNTCAIEQSANNNPPYNSSNFASLTSAAACAFNVQRVQEFTIGFWQDAYKGDLGRVRVGAEYEYVKSTAFAGAPGATTAASRPTPV